MRIFIDNFNPESSSGPNTFVRRLLTQLVSLGCKLTSACEADLALVVEERTAILPEGLPFIQRLDGIWYKPSEIDWANRLILKTYREASGVIFQSMFDLRLITTLLGWTSAPATVIPNGAETAPPAAIPESIRKLRESTEVLFVAAAEWRPQKRLQSNLALFRHLRKHQFPNALLAVLGPRPADLAAEPGVHYLGMLREAECQALYSIADWLLHLAWADHCPNVVVEALAQGCPVVCSSVGGTSELVGANGVILTEPTAYTFGPTNYDTPPRFDSFEGFALPVRPSVGRTAHGIVRCAQEYLSFFQRCIAEHAASRLT